jgi:hypothetical protein
VHVDVPTLGKAVAGARRSPRILRQRFGPTVSRILHLTLGPGPDTRDLAEEIFARVLRDARVARRPRPLKEVVIAATIAASRDEDRRRRKQPPARISGAAHDVDGGELRSSIDQLLWKTAPGDRAALILRLIDAFECLKPFSGRNEN